MPLLRCKAIAATLSVVQPFPHNLPRIIDAMSYLQLPAKGWVDRGVQVNHTERIRVHKGASAKVVSIGSFVGCDTHYLARGVDAIGEAAIVA